VVIGPVNWCWAAGRITLLDAEERRKTRIKGLGFFVFSVLLVDFLRKKFREHPWESDGSGWPPVSGKPKMFLEGHGRLLGWGEKKKGLSETVSES